MRYNPLFKKSVGVNTQNPEQVNSFSSESNKTPRLTAHSRKLLLAIIFTKEFLTKIEIILFVVNSCPKGNRKATINLSKSESLLKHQCTRGGIARTIGGIRNLIGYNNDVLNENVCYGVKAPSIFENCLLV